MLNQHIVFSGMQVLIGDQWHEKLAVVVKNKKIAAIVPVAKLAQYLPAKHYEFDAGCYLSPGLIDMHIHGAKGFDVMDASVDAFANIGEALAAEGVTSYLATTMSASDESIENVLTLLAMHKEKLPGAALLGVHLEGPFLSRKKTGAQNQAYLQAPDLAKIQRWQKLSGNNIKLITLAPELDQAMSCIKALSEMGILVSLGHSDADYDTAKKAFEQGSCHATHLFNAMRELHHREPGIIAAALLNDAVCAELIVDGYHLHPAIVQLAYKLKGRDKLILVSDAIRAKCMGNGCFELGGQMVEVDAGRATLPDGALAGSTLAMPQAIKNMVAFSGCSLADAIAMASYVPAKQLGIEQNKGRIASGADADLVVFDKDLQVLLSMIHGHCTRFEACVELP